MAQALRVLIVEDDERDAALMLRELQRGDYDVTYERVDTPEAMSAALESQPWDLVLSDFTMPRFSAPAALSLVKERALDLPFIIVSGTIGEEAAVTSLRAGAHDFVVKGALARLVPAIERERRDAGVRAERKKMHEQLLISERMASVGLLAAGVAHEINNPLAILVANLELASEQLSRLAPQAEVPRATAGTGETVQDRESSSRTAELDQLIRDAQEAAERVRLIVHDLRILSRSNDEEQQGPVEIHGVLETSIRMTSNEFRYRAQLIRDYGEVPLVKGSEAKLSQVCHPGGQSRNKRDHNRHADGWCRMRGGRDSRYRFGHSAEHPASCLRRLFHHQGPSRRNRARSRHLSSYNHRLWRRYFG
jgi:signal transduction histidine kinase